MGLLTVQAAAAVYLEERLRRHELEEGTERNLRSILANFAAAAGDGPVAELTGDMVGAWLESMAHLAPATRRSRYSAVHVFCGWLVRHGYVVRDPTIDVASPRQPRSVPRALPAPSVAAVLDVAPDSRGRLILTLMVQQGLRCCEVERLQMGDLDRLNGQMRVTGKGGHERILPILPETADALDEYLAEHPTHAGPLVRSYRRPARALRADTISGMVSEWMDEAHIKRARRDGVSAHALRHTTATDMLRGGAHLRDVQYALGHAHLSTTEVYLPFVVRGLQDAMGGRSYRRGGGVAGPLHQPARTVPAHRARPGEDPGGAPRGRASSRDAGGPGATRPPPARAADVGDRGALGRAG